MLTKLESFIFSPIVYNAILFVLITSTAILAFIILYGILVLIPRQKVERENRHINYRLNRYTSK
ncbi:MAG: hypothetical protein ACYDH2_13790 [Anaerolineaceae bacterium]